MRATPASYGRQIADVKVKQNKEHVEGATEQTSSVTTVDIMRPTMKGAKKPWSKISL